MTWSDFYLLCFLVGFSLSVLSFLAGAVHIHLPFKLHLPFQAAHHGGAGASHTGLKASTHISWFNASSAMAFLAWFGGTGYLLTRHSHLLAVVSLGLATLAGLVAGWVVFRFMVKLMSSTDSPMKSEDYRVEGSVGTVSMTIRESGGTGEIIFSLAGVRRSAGARCDDGHSIEKGAEVVVERYEKGIAYVKRWEEFTK
ncbi:MAG TPA: NfeD family protein [Candidatus Acidoferrum sp.]|nr:NfeD family protein [Candidatus Acidoferrum sp.]